MKNLLMILFLAVVSSNLSAQGFPDAQKQPKFKEQRSNHRKYAKRAKRRHVKRGTVYLGSDNFNMAYQGLKPSRYAIMPVA